MTTIAPSHSQDEFNAASYFIDRHIAEGRGENIAIECGDTRLNCGQLFELVNRVGTGSEVSESGWKSAFFCSFSIHRDLPQVSSV